MMYDICLRVGPNGTAFHYEREAADALTALYELGFYNGKALSGLKADIKVKVDYIRPAKGEAF
jgi:hypothetical protein